VWLIISLWHSVSVLTACVFLFVIEFRSVIGACVDAQLS
jgi:hypothetical protein